MYSEKEVAALIKAYNKHGGNMTPESFVKSAEKESGWNYDDKEPAVFGESENSEDGYMVKMEMMFNVPCKDIGLMATEREIREEFKRINPWIVNAIDRDEQIMVFKNGDMRGRGFVGVELVEEKAPEIEDHVLEGKEEDRRYEVYIKKIIYDDDTWSILTYEVDNGQLNKGINIPNCLDAVLSSLVAVIRSSGELQGQYMKKTIDGLNALYLDASIKEQTYKTKRK